MKFDTLQALLSKTSATIASLFKVAVMSKKPSPRSDSLSPRDLVILGNGPSLRQAIDQSFDWLVTRDLLAVNFAALAPDFLSLRPRYYLLADGHFFNALATDKNVRHMWDILSGITWQMTLLVPTKYRHLVKPLIMNSRNIRLRFFNLTPVEGFSMIKKMLFKSGLGMPRPRNVLIPAIMEGIRLGYKRIYLCGADHTWTRTLSVDDENFVVSIQPHFYKDNEDEHNRVREAYKGLHVHDVLGSMTVAFRSYWEISAYAKDRKIQILNATPGSMIDAFPRVSIL